MKSMPFQKYRPFPPVGLKDRTWPDRSIPNAPQWCSVDLRDGNQALVLPMNLEEKLEFFKLLVEIGLKEIEVGFPSAAQVEFDFVRQLIEKKLIPADVTVQVLTQAREHLIKRSFESLRGVRRAIMHLYNSTSSLQRDVVFGKSKEEIKQIAVEGAKLVRQEAEKLAGSEFIFQYSPESFMGTELPYALEVCEAVLDVWEPTPAKKVILNLPNTVELSGPHVYADMIEWFIRKLRRRDSVILSVHTHNDRGSAVTAAEFAVQAGADRVEGTLFGNGERTGNVDLVTLALNLFSHGVDPQLDFSNINRIIETSNRLTRIPVPVRHPYAGELVYTAFSGSHQDAINKGMRRYEARAGENPVWEVPYLPIDPKDVGRTYESLIRINSQSGKGGVAFIMERDFGFILPKEMHPEFGALIQKISDITGSEVLPEAIFESFQKEYLNGTEKHLIELKSFHVVHYRPAGDGGEVNEVEAEITENGKSRKIKGEGNGPIDAFVKALHSDGSPAFRLTSYHQHALGSGSDSRAAAYIQIESKNGDRFFGVGVDANTNLASIRAIVSALNRSRAR